MNVKKFLAMLLAVAMLGGALAACGGGETTSTPSGNTGTPAGNSEIRQHRHSRRQLRDPHC